MLKPNFIIFGPADSDDEEANIVDLNRGSVTSAAGPSSTRRKKEVAAPRKRKMKAHNTVLEDDEAGVYSAT
ncbi:hypothetical protein ACS0TY_021106 [Phlomoides rotata]